MSRARLALPALFLVPVAVAGALPAQAAPSALSARPAAAEAPARPAAGAASASLPDLPRLPELSVTRSVTHGTVVKRPASTVPWVLPLWHVRKGATSADALCSTSAISPTEIVTAAHCVPDAKGLYYVEIGANALRKGTLVPVEAIRFNSGYRDRTAANDIAMLRPLVPLKLAAYAKLATPAMAARARAGRLADLRIYGWGDNEKGKLTGQLRTTSLRQMNALADRTFRYFSPQKQLAAARSIGRGRYAGGCQGDSGGPLATKVGKAFYVVGVSSFGAASGCDRAPTVFTSVGAYSVWTKATRASLPKLARTQNRALPYNVSAPVASGTVGLGQAISCGAGSWTANTSSVVPEWYVGSVKLEAGPDHVLTPADAGKTLTCKVTATSRAGTATASVEVPVPPAPSPTAYPDITGLPAAGAMPAPGTTLTCAVPATTVPGVVTTYEWLSLPGIDAVTDVRPLGAGPTLVLSADVLKAAAGRYLTCRATSANAMGSVTQSDWAYVPQLSAPRVDLSVAGAGTAGVTLTCTPVLYEEGLTVSYRWAASSTLSSSTLPADARILSSTAATYQLQQAERGSYVYCEATVSSWQGTTVKVARTTSRVS
ncbi:S1 family peptidase [Motilibacter aurantiacus]|uniref:S1 family peptidase n=1 Tax=Motilibacter aurantiacus TaxID=2714955 RepID=UPI00140910B2|nr:trypsin-like serine protease [Motilibacter aurantiacus]NHC45512.1 trypsin-like serine protease [Motilibacter aurantiacus]